MPIPKLLICIPTLKGREDYFQQAIDGYIQRTPEVRVHIEVVHDLPSAGVGWQECVERGLEHMGEPPDYIHFGNDDILVAEGWWPPLQEAIDQGYVPAPRVEAGGHWLEQRFGYTSAPISSPNLLAEPPPRTKHSYWYSDLPKNQPKTDWKKIDHGAFPTCSLEQWEKIGPFIPIHFGTDIWFYHRARAAGYKVVARMDSVIFNFAAGAGRHKGEWDEIDFLDFDLVIAYPEYSKGIRKPTDPHPLRMTPEGLKLAREWRMKNFDGPYHWETK